MPHFYEKPRAQALPLSGYCSGECTIKVLESTVSTDRVNDKICKNTNDTKVGIFAKGNTTQETGHIIACYVDKVKLHKGEQYQYHLGQHLLYETSKVMNVKCAIRDMIHKVVVLSIECRTNAATCYR